MDHKITLIDVVSRSGLQQHDIIAEVNMSIVARRRRSAPLAILLGPQPQLLHPATPGQCQPIGRGHALQTRHFQHQLRVVHAGQKRARRRAAGTYGLARDKSFDVHAAATATATDTVNSSSGGGGGVA